MFLFWAVLRIKPMALHMLDKGSSNISSPLLPLNNLWSTVPIKRKDSVDIYWMLSHSPCLVMVHSTVVLVSVLLL